MASFQVKTSVSITSVVQNHLWNSAIKSDFHSIIAFQTPFNHHHIDLVQFHNFEYQPDNILKNWLAALPKTSNPCHIILIASIKWSLKL
jgi:hypothetical protein